MKEVIFEKIGSQPTLGETEKPVPADDQILVKSLWTAMNPVYVQSSLCNTLVPLTDMNDEEMASSPTRASWSIIGLQDLGLTLPESL